MRKKVAALMLSAIGALGLTYGGLNRSYQSDAKAGIVRGSDTEHKANLPMWAGFGALLLSGLLITYRARRR